MTREFGLNRSTNILNAFRYSVQLRRYRNVSARIDELVRSLQQSDFMACVQQ